MGFNAREFLRSLFEIHSSVDLPGEWLEEYEERAAILEFDGGLTRQQAETEALREIEGRIKNLKKW